MKRFCYAAVIIGAAAVVLLLQGGTKGVKAANGGMQAFGFNAPLVTGFPGRSVEITGGGSYQLPFTIHAGGGFRCLSDITAPPPPFAGCLTGQGVRWDPAALLASTSFKCTGAASEARKTASTDDKTVVLLADFYRQGDGNNESFTARMIVSQTDIAPEIPGVQTVWIGGIGCGEAATNFN